MGDTAILLSMVCVHAGYKASSVLWWRNYSIPGLQEKFGQFFWSRDASRPNKHTYNALPCPWSRTGALSWPCEATCEKHDPKSIERDELRFANHSTALDSVTELPKEETERSAAKSNGVYTERKLVCCDTKLIVTLINPRCWNQCVGHEKWTSRRNKSRFVALLKTINKSWFYCKSSAFIF